MTEKRPQSDPKKRTCLKCGKLFDSAGPGNRICRRCARRNGRIRVTEDELQKQRGRKWHNGIVISDLEDYPQLDLSGHTET